VDFQRPPYAPPSSTVFPVVSAGSITTDVARPETQL
jgi:hypothetical protein